MPLKVKLSDLMDAIDSDSDFDDYGYFLDPRTGVTYCLWDMQASDGHVNGSEELFERLSERLDDFIKLPHGGLIDHYQRAEDFAAMIDVDDKTRKKLKKACKKARRWSNIMIFQGEVSDLGLHAEELAYELELDEVFVRQWCQENGIAIEEDIESRIRS